MVIVWWVLGGILVFVIAALAVGRVTAHLVAAPSRAVYDADQALEFVAEALPSSVTSQLSYDDVRLVMRLFHDHLHDRGVATTAGDDPRLGARSQIVDPDDATDYVVWRAALHDIVLDRAHVDAIIEAQMEYFAAIGVVGEMVDGPDDPE
ncbi:MAG: hypothetical protein ACXIVQ_03410 [Acidimicrobiales bacterium]